MKKRDRQPIGAEDGQAENLENTARPKETENQGVCHVN